VLSYSQQWPRALQELQEKQRDVDNALAAAAHVQEKLSKLQEASGAAKKALTQLQNKTSRARSKADGAKRTLQEKESSQKDRERQFAVRFLTHGVLKQGALSMASSFVLQGVSHRLPLHTIT
jgi:chromosome segregation ATPase